MKYNYKISLTCRSLATAANVNAKTKINFIMVTTNILTVSSDMFY